MKIAALLLTVLVLPLVVHAQHADTSLYARDYARSTWRTDSLLQFRAIKYRSVMIGLSLGNYVFGDVGYAMNYEPLHAFEAPGISGFVSSEVRFTNKLLIGPKIGFWAGNGLAFGLNLIYYTDFENGGSLVFRPEIGIGLWMFKMVYGYNAALTNTSFRGINRNLFQIDFCIPTSERRVRFTERRS